MIDDDDAQPAIETRGLRRVFGELVAVESLDLTIARGEIFGLLGPNGAGKSTTIKMLTTLLPPSSGVARVCGLDVARQATEVRRRIGYVPQMLSADGGLTGRENLSLSARLYRIPRAKRAGLIREALAFMDLVSSADVLVRTYSGGMIRRLELAQAMLHQPQILILDEQTIGLDPVARHVVWERLLDLQRARTMTILLTTHDMEEADLLCGRIAILHAGVVGKLGSPAELKAATGPAATLEDVFTAVAGGSIGEGGSYRDVRQLRRTFGRLG